MTKSTKAEVLLIAAIVFSLTNFCSPTRTEVEYIPDSFYSRIVFVDFTVNEELRIREGMAPLFTARCKEAHVRAGLRSPAEVVLNEGLVIMPSHNLYRYSPRRLGFVDNRTRTLYRREFSSGRAQAGTVSHTLYGVRLTTDGRSRLFLHPSAFAGESFIFGWLSLNGVLSHEFIHLGGQPPTPGWLFGHDLSGFENYDEIMEACTCREAR